MNNQISDSALLAMYRERFSLPPGAEAICASKEVILHLRSHLQHRDREQFLIIYLNGRNQIIKTETLFTGTINSSAVYPREVIKSVLKNEASGIILAHNHPSENRNPSQDDRKITNILKQACELIDVSVLDHVIITADDYYSFADHGLI